MDNVTHGLLGTAIGMVRRRSADPSPENRATDTAVIWAALAAAELPDADTFIGRGPMAEFTWHRAFTHSLAFTPVVAFVAAGIAKLVWRKAKFGTLYLWSLASVLIAHLLNDYMTGWGTRLLLPFSQARLGLDWVPIVDLLYTVPLLVAVIIAWRRPSLRRKAVVAVLGYLLLYTFGYRGISHALVERAVSARYAGQNVAQLQVSPDMLNPMAWSYTVDLGDRYERGQAYATGSVESPTVISKGPDDPVTRAVRSAPELQPFFAQFHYVTVFYRQTAEGYTASMGDVRYGVGGHGMTYQVSLNQQLQVTQIKSGGW
ncbi:MAG: metal-dependent hydrolase [Mycobacterium leprae]